MKSINMKKVIKYFLIILFFAIFIGGNVVYAATSSKIAFCDYGGVRRTFKIVGILLNIVKTLVPLAIIFVAISKFASVIISGKTDDLKASTMQVVKNGVAGLIIFCLPGVIDFAIDNLVEYDDSGFAACSNCLLDVDHCVIPDVDPETYEED